MRKWMRERLMRRRKKKKAPTETESTGRTGQPRPASHSTPPPLQPMYPEPVPESPALTESRPHPPSRKAHVERRPEAAIPPPAPPEAATAAAHASGKAKAAKGVVVLAIGLPGSGKSTWFKRRGVTPLSSDLLRSILFDDITEQRHQGLVFSTLRSLLRARLIAKMPWNYVDATNLSPRERRQWIQMARSFGFEVHAVFFDVPVEICMERNSRRQRIVPEDVMQRMAAKLKPPKFEEGFSKIVVVRVKEPRS